MRKTNNIKVESVLNLLMLCKEMAINATSSISRSLISRNLFTDFKKMSIKGLQNLYSVLYLNYKSINILYLLLNICQSLEKFAQRLFRYIVAKVYANVWIFHCWIVIWSHITTVKIYELKEKVSNHTQFDFLWQCLIRFATIWYKHMQ